MNAVTSDPWDLTSMFGNLSTTALSAWMAHALAWAVGIWLVFGPAYAGVSMTPDGGTIQHTRTFIEVNGLETLWVPLVPILLTGIGLQTVHLTAKGKTGRRVLLWSLGASLLVFCALGVLSFGMLYLPVTLMFLVAAFTDLR